MIDVDEPPAHSAIEEVIATYNEQYSTSRVASIYKYRYKPKPDSTAKTSAQILILFFFHYSFR